MCIWNTLRANMALMTCAVTLGLLPLSGGAQMPNEYDVKAAFLLNFANFVEWPADTFATPSSPLMVVVVGDDPFGGALHRLAQNKIINGRQLVVRRIDPGDTFVEIQIMFLSASERGRVAKILRKVGDSSVLTVSDLEGFCQKGGMIQIAREENRIRFDVDLTPAQRSRLTISARLLGLARIVFSKRGLA